MLWIIPKRFSVALFFGWSNFIFYPWISKSIRREKSNFKELCLWSGNFWYKLLGERKWKKNSWKLWRHNLIWFDMFFWRKNACILLNLSTHFRNKRFMLDEIILQKKTSNFLTNEFSDLRSFREKHKTMWVIRPIPKIVWQLLKSLARSFHQA